MTLDAATIKSCCTSAYSHDLVALLLGESYHPGGLALTSRLADGLDLPRGARVLDVACGRGSSALLLAREYGVTVEGVDLAAASVAAASAAAADAGLSGSLRFQVADAERLPFPPGSFDAVLCECALCTFPDKPTAAAEFARVLRPGGRLGLSDVTVGPGGLPEELADLVGWVSCLADAQSVDGYHHLLAGAGLDVQRSEAHDGALAQMVSQIQARLQVLRMLAGSQPALAQVDFGRALELARLAAEAIRDGRAGYGAFIAVKAAPGRDQ